MEQMESQQFLVYFVLFTLSVAIVYGVFTYYFMKDKGKEKQVVDSKKNVSELLNQYKYIEINSKVEKFLLNSNHFEKLATWKNEIIYKYIYKEGYLYEFDDIMPDTNHRIGIDEKFLCFKQLTYKRVIDPKVIDTLKDKLVSNTDTLSMIKSS